MRLVIAGGPPRKSRPETGNDATGLSNSTANHCISMNGQSASALLGSHSAIALMPGGVSSVRSLPLRSENANGKRAERSNPICIDLFAGLGGWAEGFLAEGYTCIGFDITRHQYGESKYPGQLVIQDVLTLHGSQFRDAAVIVASPPCQNYSYLAMPWSRSPDFVRPSGDGWEVLNSAAAKEMREEWEREGPDNRLFDACFRIQREAIEATERPCPDCSDWHVTDHCSNCEGTRVVRRFIPLVVENVRGAQPWVGRSAWNFGSYHLWGDVPALMPIRLAGQHNKIPSAVNASIRNGKSPARWTNSEEHYFGAIPDDGTKIGGDWFSDPNSTCRKHGSRSNARKAASAEIAKIPLPLSEHIARVFKPRDGA